MNAGVDLLDRIVTYIIDPTLRVIFTAGLLLFFWGIVRYLMDIKDGKTGGDGRMHMLWGLVGMLIMVSAYGIIAIVLNTLEIDLNTATDISRIQNVNPGINFWGN